MSKYNQPNSKRKQKSKAKREQREFVQDILKSSKDYVSGVACAMTPEEFMLAEAKESFIPQEVTTVKHKAKFKEPRLISAAA